LQQAGVWHEPDELIQEECTTEQCEG
jgi:hypothetical protein